MVSQHDVCVCVCVEALIRVRTVVYSVINIRVYLFLIQPLSSLH